MLNKNWFNQSFTFRRLCEGRPYHAARRDASTWYWAPIWGPFAAVLITLGSSNIVETMVWTISLVLAYPGAALCVWRQGQASLIITAVGHLEIALLWLMELLFDSGSDITSSDKPELCGEGFVSLHPPSLVYDVLCNSPLCIDDSTMDFWNNMLQNTGRIHN